MRQGIKGLLRFHFPESMVVLLLFYSTVGEKLGYFLPVLFNPYSLLLLISIQKNHRERTSWHKVIEQPKYHLWTQKRIVRGPNRTSFHDHCLFVILGQVITSGGITFRDQPWHKECFLCSGCRKELCEEEFMSRDDYPFCLDCYNHLYAKKCAACTKPITGEFFSLIWSYDAYIDAIQLIWKKRVKK